MTINEIKIKTGQTTLMLVRQMEQEHPEVPTVWLSHWDNDNRIRVTMHDDVLKTIKANPERADLALKSEIVPATAERKEYKRFVVITPLNVEATF